MTFLYPTASTVAVFLNGYHVEQAYQIQHKETINKVPIFGYADHTYSKIAYGRQMVNGVLVVNYIFAGYLNTIIDTLYNDSGAYVPKLYNYGFSEKGESQKQKLIKDIQGQLRTELPPNQDSETRSARASYIASLITKDKASRDATKEALERFVTNESQNDGSLITSLESPLALVNDGITLDVYYQDPEFCTWYVSFKNIHFYDVSQVVSMAGAEGSSDPLYEVYSFMASKRVIKLVQEIE